MPKIITGETYKVSTIPIAATTAELRLIRGGGDRVEGTEDLALAVLAGDSAVFDQTPKIFIWDPDNTTADNGTSIIAPTGVTTGRWRSP